MVTYVDGMDQVRVNLRDGEHDQGGRRAVAGLLDHLLVHHPLRNGGRERPLLVTITYPSR